MKPSLAQALTTASPRRNPPATPWASLLIHGGVLALWLALFGAAFVFDGVLAWATGLLYVAYDTGLLVFVFWQTRHVGRAGAGQSAARPATLGVIVAAYNEAAVLPAMLAALAAQDEPPDEILIADDGSTDRTAAVLRERYGLALPEAGGASLPSPLNPGLRWLRLPHGGKAAALNAGLIRIGTEIVLTVDADTALEPGAIAAMRRAFARDPDLVAATGVLTPICAGGGGARIFQWFQTYEYIRNFLSRYAWMQLDSLLLISGAFAGFRRAAVLEVGGFDTDCLVEDYELIHRLRRYGAEHGRDWRTAVVGDALGRTDAPATIPGFLAQRRRWFGGFLQTQYWYRAMVGAGRFGWLGTVMLPVKAVDTVQPLYGLTAFFLLLFYIATGRLRVLAPVGFVIAAKIGIDLAFHLWSVRIYRRWVGGHTRAGFGWALAAALAEPFSFQILRHLGAAWGWITFLRGQGEWGANARRQGQAAVPKPVLP